MRPGPRWREERYAVVWRAKGNAYNAVFAKAAAELSRDDAILVGCEVREAPCRLTFSTTVQPP